MSNFKELTENLRSDIELWVNKLSNLSDDLILNKRNIQNRNIKQILGHMVDSASNNTHRIIHLQYQPSPLVFPDYANLGNNDRWIAIQNYEAEDWQNLIQLWKYANLHICHVIENVNPKKLDNSWISATSEEISLQQMILGYLPHFKLHLAEINDVLKTGI